MTGILEGGLAAESSNVRALDAKISTRYGAAESLCQMKTFWSSPRGLHSVLLENKRGTPSLPCPLPTLSNPQEDGGPSSPHSTALGEPLQWL